MVRFAFRRWGDIRVCGRVSNPVVQPDIRASGGTQANPARNRLDRECRFLAQPCRHFQLPGITFAPLRQFVFAPANRPNSSATMRSALAAPTSWRSCPEWCSPSWPSSSSSSRRLNASPPKHHPRRNPCNASASVSAHRRASMRRANSCRLAALSGPSPCSPNSRSTRIQPGRCSAADEYHSRLL